MAHLERRGGHALPQTSLNDLRSNCRLPAHFYIDIGNLCNLRCPFCITGSKKLTDASGFMRLHDYRVILRKIRQSAKLISLYNWGEPLMHPDLHRIIEVTARAGIRTHIDTNLSVKDLSPEDAEALVATGLSSLFASIDGMSQETYQAYRVRGKLSRVFHNLQELSAAKRRLQSQTPFLGWQFHVHKFNEADLPAAMAHSEALGIPIVVKRLSTPEPSWKSAYHETDDMFVASSAWFHQVYSPPGNPDLSGIDLHPQLLSPCRQMFETMIVEWNGNVYPCTVVAGPRHVMGNLLKQSLHDVWNGRQFIDSRDFVHAFGPSQGGPSICENEACALHRKCAA